MHCGDAGLDVVITRKIIILIFNAMQHSSCRNQFQSSAVCSKSHAPRPGFKQLKYNPNVITGGVKNRGHVEGVNVCAGQSSPSQPARVYVFSRGRKVGFNRSADLSMSETFHVFGGCANKVQYIHVQGEGCNSSVTIVTMLSAGRFGWNYGGRK